MTTRYYVTFSHTIEVNIDGDERDAEDKAFEEFGKLLREYPSTNYFVSDVEEAD